MAAAVTLYRSSLGKKFVMAVTGIILFGFVFVHMIGNLKIYQGEEKLNAYAVFLREVGGPIFAHEQLLWILRLLLLAAVGLHIAAAYQLTRMSQRGRPVAYARRRDVQASYASRTMRWGGVIILLFVIYHVVKENVYRNVISAFQIWYVSAFYILAMLALGLHMYHGLWSMWQSLGLSNKRINGLIRGGATVFTVITVLGNVSIPIAVLAGFLR
jgi:succinate dehydrogenase / fumarate reductase cytochrome b subunit